MSDWPEIPYAPWAKSASNLHMWLQIVGKYRLARTPWWNHSWHATFYVSARGLTTSLVQDAGEGVEIEFDFLDHSLRLVSSNGKRSELVLEAMSVADFQRLFRERLSQIGASPDFHGAPNEVPDPVPFEQQIEPGHYDRQAVHQFWRALLAIDGVFKRFRTGFLGKCSPVHFFWGSFDLAVTRFSGRKAPLHPGGVPALPDTVTREAYSHEVSSAGFWPGDGGVDEAMFYSYAYPVPEGFSAQPVLPDAAYFDTTLGEFLLPYEAVRLSPDPEGALLSFLTSTYAAAAERGNWYRAELDAPLAEPGVPRAVDPSA